MMQAFLRHFRHAWHSYQQRFANVRIEKDLRWDVLQLLLLDSYLLGID